MGKLKVEASILLNVEWLDPRTLTRPYNPFELLKAWNWEGNVILGKEFKIRRINEVPTLNHECDAFNSNIMQQGNIKSKTTSIPILCAPTSSRIMATT